MNKLIFLFSAFLVLLLQSALAQNITLSLQGSSFIAGQTVIADIGMERFSISKLSLLDSSNAKVPVGFYNYNYAKNKNYAYFNLPESASGSYTLLVSEKILVGGVLEESNASASFSVSAGNAFTITPVAVKISPASSYFKIALRHTAGTPFDVAVSASDAAIKPIRNSVSLAVNEMKTLTVNYDGLKLKNDAKLTLSSGALSYSIPLFAPVQANATQLPNVTVQENQTLPASFDGALKTVKNITIIKRKANITQELASPLEIINTASEPLHDILFTSSGIPSITFKEASVAELMPSAVYSQYISVNKGKNIAPGKYFGSITIQSKEGAFLVIPVELEFMAVSQGETGASNDSAIVQKPKTDVTVTPANGSLGIAIVNYSELQKKSAEEKAKSLRIALALAAVVFIIVFLFFYRIRPKTYMKNLGEYVEEIGKPKKK